MIRSMRYEIIKPVGTTWQDFGMVFNDLRYTSARIANYTVQKLWEWDNFRWEYKLEVNEFPNNKSKPNIYRLSRELFPEVGCSVISQINRWVENRYASISGQSAEFGPK